MSPGGEGPVRLGDLLPGGGVGQSSGPEADICRVWEEVVGKDVARNTRPLTLRRGRLTVAASSPAWAQTLQMLSSETIDGLGRALGEGVVVEVVFRHAGWEEPSATAGSVAQDRRPPERSLSEEEERIVNEVAALAGDSELARRVGAAMRADLRSRPAGDER